MEQAQNLNIDEKFTLTIYEAADYFNIGQHTLRNLVAIEDNDYSLKIGRKVLIKKDKFIDYLNRRKKL